MAGAGSSNLAAMGGGQGLLASQGLAASGMGGGQGLLAGGVGAGYASGAGSGLLSASNLRTANDLAMLAQTTGVLGSNPAPPQAQSAGIPARQADFSGLLAAGKGQQRSGAERLIAQRAARSG